MAENETANSVGWTDCGKDGNGKQVLVNLLGLRHIEIAHPCDDQPEATYFDVDVELVTLYYGGVEGAITLGAEHSKQFLLATKLRAPASSLLHMPEMNTKIPLI